MRSRQKRELSDDEFVSRIDLRRRRPAGQSSTVVCDYSYEPLGVTRVFKAVSPRGIEVTIEDITAPVDLYIHNERSVTADECVASVFFSGGHATLFPDSGSSFEYGGNVNWYRTPGERSSTLMRAGERIFGCHLGLPRSFLAELFPETKRESAPLVKLLAGRESGMVEPGFQGLGLRPAVEALLSHPLDSPWDWLNLEARIIGLVSLVLERSVGRLDGPAGVSAADRERLNKAKDILESRLCDPPSLSELSRLVGLNEFKLKRDFKRLFGTTVYGHLQAVRLETAAALLRSGYGNVTEVSAEVGYASPAAFSVAFARRFGASPSDYRRKIY